MEESEEVVITIRGYSRNSSHPQLSHFVRQQAQQVKRLRIRNGLRDCHLQDVVAFSEYLTSADCQLEHLELDGSLAMSDNDESINALAFGLEKNTSLAKIEFCRRSEPDLGCVYQLLCAISNRCSHLELLQLIGFPLFGTVGAMGIVNILNSKIEKLNLINCNLGEDGMELIGEALKTCCCSLQLLNINGCQIGNAGAMALAEALKTNTSLIRLYVYWCDVGKEEGLSMLAKLPSFNHSLKSFHLSEQQELNMTVVREFASTLVQNTTLQNVRLETVPADHRVSYKSFLNGVTMMNAAGRCYLRHRTSRLDGLRVLESVISNVDCLFVHLRENPGLVIATDRK